MSKLATNILNLIEELEKYIKRSEVSELNDKPNADKWSKKEIIGHLIDSGINNLQRFTEISFSKEVYHVKSYAQDDLVRANHYQTAQLSELMSLWKALNYRIVEVIQHQNEESLAALVKTEGGEHDLKFLIEDYVQHLKHHIAQITK